ncbi:DNA-3-methyladenine glycosylase family protein [Agrococcus casei]|uniref:DNA-3-methyladenine glycosylase family protein n=1 Tax=Agrococcus casei TaxID=343512 RepID=UPI003F915867
MAAPLFVAARGPWDRAAALHSLSTHAIDGLDRAEPDEARHTRVMRVEGRALPVTVRLNADGVRATAADGSPLPDAAAPLIRRWFDLDADIEQIDAHLAGSAVLAPQVSQRPGIRITRYVDDFEAVVSIILGQQVTLAAGRIFLGRLVDAFGEPVDGLRALPTPERLAETEFEALRDALRMTRARAATVHDVSRLYADGFTLKRGEGRAESLGTLAAVRGIGPWTLSTLGIRTLDDTDALPTSDAVLRRALAAHDLTVDHPHLQTWSPYRSYATVRLWSMGA